MEKPEVDTNVIEILAAWQTLGMHTLAILINIPYFITLSVTEQTSILLAMGNEEDAREFAADVAFEIKDLDEPDHIAAIKATAVLWEIDINNPGKVLV